MTIFSPLDRPGSRLYHDFLRRVPAIADRFAQLDPNAEFLQRRASAGISRKRLQNLATTSLAPFAPSLFFVPMRGAFARGIHTSMTFRTAEAHRIIDAVKTFAASTRFVRYYDDLPDLKRVINTNRCALGVTVQGDRVLIVSVLDNLIKGAAGQAVQNMNIALGLAEDSGLNLKSIVY